MNYFRMFPDHKISGLIDIGGAPIQFYPRLAKLISNFHLTTADFLMENIDQVHEGYTSDPALK